MPLVVALAVAGAPAGRVCPGWSPTSVKVPAFQQVRLALHGTGHSQLEVGQECGQRAELRDELAAVNRHVGSPAVDLVEDVNR